MSLPPSTTSTTTTSTGGATITVSHSDIPHDIIRAHILPRLDGPTLASTSCASRDLHSLSSDEELWMHLCHSTWPSTRSTPRVKRVVSGFHPHGPRSFFSQAFPLYDEHTESASPHMLTPSLPTMTSAPCCSPLSGLISAVDVFYKEEVIMSKTVETETSSEWFTCSPFRMDLIDLKDTCPTPMRTEEGCKEMRLSWVVIDPSSCRRAVNVSSGHPLSVERHWLSGDLHVRFGVVMGGGRVFVQCNVVVTRAMESEGEMRVREVSLQVEDLDGMVLNGKDSVGILHAALEGSSVIPQGRIGGKVSYEMFLKMKKERKERKLRAEGRLDMFCVAFGVLSFASLCFYVFFK